MSHNCSHNNLKSTQEIPDAIAWIGDHVPLLHRPGALILRKRNQPDVKLNLQSKTVRARHMQLLQDKYFGKSSDVTNYPMYK